MRTMPIQNALMFPAGRPARRLSDAPPSREEVTTSRVWADSVEVKTLTTSGMMAPASVPQMMMSESFHHWEWCPPPRVGMGTYETGNVRTTETIEVSHTRNVSGCSKFILLALAFLPF